MTNTANETKTDDRTAPLAWTRKKEWGSVGNTYYAESDEYRYAVDSPKKGEWVLRGWGPEGQFLYRPDHRTMKAAKEAAQKHVEVIRHRAEMRRAEMRRAVDAMPPLATESLATEPLPIEPPPAPQTVAEALAKLPTAAEAVAAGMRAVAVVAGSLGRAARHRAEMRQAAVETAPLLPVEPQPCACPTPTHRMSCGTGARPRIVRRRPVRLIDSGLGLLPVPEDTGPHPTDDECVDGAGDAWAGHLFGAYECTRCGAEAGE